MAYLVRQTMEFSDGTTNVVEYTEVPTDQLADYEPLMDETQNVEEAPVETPAEEVSPEEVPSETPAEEIPAE